MLTRNRLLAGASVLAAASFVLPAWAQDTIKIGELNSYKVFAAFLEPYKKGWEMAVDEVNAAGGVLGKKIEIVSRDDNGNPADAVRVAEELLSLEKVAFLIGTFPSNVGLAVADFAKQRKTLFIAAEPLTDKIVWDAGNANTFRLRASTYMQTAMLIPDKIDAGALTQALADAKPEAIFSSLFGADLAKFVREGQQRGLFKGVEVFNLLAGEPEYLDPLKDEAPVGWYVTGYPWYDIKTPEHKKFLDAYQAKYKDYPRLGSVVGYSTVMAAAAVMKKAGSLEQEKLIAAMANLPVGTPFGTVTFRALDHQSTMGAYVGRIGLKDGKGVMTDWRFVDGKDALPSDEDIKKMRPSN